MPYLDALNFWMVCKKVTIPRWLRDAAMMLAIGLFGLFFYYMVRMAIQVNTVVRSQTVQITTFRYYTALSNAESGQRGYLLSGDDRCLKQYNDAKTALFQQVEMLKSYDYSDREQEVVTKLIADTDSKVKEMESTIIAFKSQGQDAALTIFRTGIGIELKQSIQKGAWSLISLERNHVMSTAR